MLWLMIEVTCWILAWKLPFSSPEAATLLVSTENHDLWPGPTTFRFEWLCKHNRLRPEPIRFVRLDSEHAQSNGKSVNRGLPELDLARSRDFQCWLKGSRPLGMRMGNCIKLSETFSEFSFNCCYLLTDSLRKLDYWGSVCLKKCLEYNWTVRLTDWRQFFIRLSCYWSWISSSHCQSSCGSTRR